MTLLTNNAEGGSSGTAVSIGNSGGASGTAFDAVTISGTGSNLTFDNGHAAHGGLAYKYAYATAAGANLDAQWSTAMGTQSQVWFRLYLYFTANPTGANLGVWSCAPAAGTCGRLFVTTAGKLQFNDSAGSQVLLSTNTVPLNQWFRVEGFLIGSATVGQEEFKLFSNMDDVSPLETQTSAANINTNSSSITRYDFGMPGTAVTQTITYWADDYGLSNVGYIGPVATSRPADPPNVFHPGNAPGRFRFILQPRPPQPQQQPLTTPPPIVLAQPVGPVDSLRLQATVDVLRGSLQDDPVLTTKPPLVVVGSTPTPAGVTTLGRSSLQDFATPQPIVVTGAAPYPVGQVTAKRGTLQDDPVLTTRPPLVITGQTPTPAGGLGYTSRSSLADVVAVTGPTINPIIVTGLTQPPVQVAQAIISYAVGVFAPDVSGPTTKPIVNAQPPARPTPGVINLSRGSLQDDPVLTTRPPIVVTGPAPRPVNTPQPYLSRSSYADVVIAVGTPSPIVVASQVKQAAASPNIILRNTLQDPPVLTTPPAIIVAAPFRRLPGDRGVRIITTPNGTDFVTYIAIPPITVTGSDAAAVTVRGASVAATTAIGSSAATITITSGALTRNPTLYPSTTTYPGSTQYPTEAAPAPITVSGGTAPAVSVN